MSHTERMAKTVRHVEVRIAQKLAGVLVLFVPPSSLPFLPPPPSPPSPCLQLLEPPRPLCGAGGSAGAGAGSTAAPRLHHLAESIQVGVQA